MAISLPVSFLALALLIESFVVKSVIFDRNDPILAHYLASGVLIGALLAWSVRRRSVWEVLRRIPGRLVALAMFGWLVVITALRPSLLEWAALVGFVLLVLGFYFAVPVALWRVRGSLRQLILWLFACCVILSMTMLVVAPAASYELPSLRFRGALISVANACNVFFFASIYFAWAGKYSQGFKKRFFYVLTILSFCLLLLTFTRSSIAQATLGLLVLLSTDNAGRLAISRCFPVLIAVIACGAGAVKVIGVDLLLESFRLVDDNLLASRDGVWHDGLARALDNFLIGTGLLTKQTKGGSAQLEFTSDNYDPSYDAHSLAITLVEQGGVGLLVATCMMLAVPLWMYQRTFGIRASLQRPEFLIMAITVPSMMFAGGDMISLGSLVNRLQWIFLGMLALEVAQARGGVLRAARPLGASGARAIA
jgi:hypothetical protein